MGAFQDITGKRFGRWVVLSQVKRTTSGRFALTYWRCQCRCGTIKKVRAASLIRGKSKSCGCLLAEYRANMITHGKSGNKCPEYSVWNNMLNRCRNPNIPGYNHYGGRGISVCVRWHKFEYFYADMGPRPSSQHSIDRRNVDAGYSKRNCRWATRKEQMNNRRKICAIQEFTIEELKAELARRKRAK